MKLVSLLMMLVTGDVVATASCPVGTNAVTYNQPYTTTISANNIIKMDILTLGPQTSIAITGIHCLNNISNYNDVKLPKNNAIYSFYIVPEEMPREKCDAVLRFSYICFLEKNNATVKVKPGASVTVCIWNSSIEHVTTQQTMETPSRNPPTQPVQSVPTPQGVPSTKAPGEQCVQGVTEGLGTVVVVLALTTIALLLYICLNKHKTAPDSLVAGAAFTQLPPQRPVSATSHDSENSIYGFNVPRAGRGGVLL